ncbi:MAG: enoyl-CoA hydratase/isomerase family protein [Dehalococcoidia bacterium]
MAHEMIIAEQHGRVGVLKFNNDRRLNALHPTMMGEARQQIDAWNEDAGVGAIVLTGEGRAFCAGADISGWNRQIERSEQGNGQQGRERREEESWTDFIIRSKPVVCAINGPAIGAGLTITLPCDVRIASPQARLSMRFVRVGVLPELASTYILPHIVGLTQALELMLSGRIISGEEAGRIGLVNRVVDAGKLLDEAISTAAEIAFNPAESLLAIKRETWQHIGDGRLGEIMRNEMREFVAAQRRPTFKEAVRSFVEKREPDFHQVDA